MTDARALSADGPTKGPPDLTVLFAGASAREQAELLRLGEVQSFRAGEDIVREGEEPRYVYIIQEGEVAALKAGVATGAEHEMGRMGPGEHFGEMALLDEGARSATVRALTAVQVLALPIARVAALAGESPSIARLMVGIARQVVARFRQANTARVDALDRALAEERTRAAMGRFVLSLILAYALYVFLLSTAAELKTILGRSEFATVPIILLMAAIQVEFMRDSGYPARFFGLTLQDAPRQVWEAVVFTLPLLLAVVVLKAALRVWLPGMQGTALFQVLDPAGGRPFRPWLALAYVAFIPFQELIFRGSMQGALERFLVGRGSTWKAILATNLIFAAGHLHVSIGLAAAVFAAGLFWGWLYSRQRGLAGVTVSHLLIGFWALEVVGFPFLT